MAVSDQNERAAKSFHSDSPSTATALAGLPADYSRVKAAHSDRGDFAPGAAVLSGVSWWTLRQPLEHAAGRIVKGATD